MLIAEWNNHEFRVDPELIRSFTDLNVKTSAGTETQQGAVSSWVSFKAAGVGTVSLKLLLSAFTGSEVYSEAQAFLADAHNGATGYFYVGGNKLLPCRLMLTSCDVGNVALTGLCQWTQAELSLTFQQCEKYSGEADASGKTSSGGKKTTKTATLKGVKEQTTRVKAQLAKLRQRTAQSGPGGDMGGAAPSGGVSKPLSFAKIE